MPLPQKILSPCQENALEILTDRLDNVFLTGRAGSGKSFLIRHFLKNKDRKKFPIVASTGVAAILVGGRTFHSFFGLGIMEGGVEETVRRALEETRVVKRLRKIDGFVLDEVSMIPGPALKAAEAICRTARESNLPWGGARVIAVGDFFQLPPINRFGGEKEWCFLEEAWEKSRFVPILLKTMMRSQDKDYMDVLNDIREGVVSERVHTYLNGRIIPEAEIKRALDTPRLFPKRDMADHYNGKRLEEIQEDLMEFPTFYSGEPKAIEAMKRNAPVPEILRLKESALIMIRSNDPFFHYMNGSLGNVIKMNGNAMEIRLKTGKEIELEKMHFSLLSADGREIATAVNFPVTLAYATTIHKAQGATLDGMVCDLRRLWEPGQAYVALSRLRTGSGLTLTGWDESSIRVDPKVVEFHRSLGNDAILSSDFSGRSSAW